MELTVLSAGGYGSRLQTTLISRLYDPSLIRIIDDFIPLGEALSSYKHLNKNILFGSYSDKIDVLVPSYEFNKLNMIKSFDDESTYVYDWNDKSFICKFISEGNYIPYIFTKDVSSSNRYVAKPMKGAGSKGIEYVEQDQTFNKADYILQEFCSGDEVLVDCLSYDNDIYFTIRKSIERQNGRDTKISFKIEDRVVSDVHSILMAMNLYGWRGPFNLQLREHNGIWKVMEIDFRFTGSSIVNKAYEQLISIYLDRVCLPYLPKVELVKDYRALRYFEGGFNELSINVFEDIGLSLPSIIE